MASMFKLLDDRSLATIMVTSGLGCAARDAALVPHLYYFCQPALTPWLKAYGFNYWKELAPPPSQSPAQQNDAAPDDVMAALLLANVTSPPPKRLSQISDTRHAIKPTALRLRNWNWPVIRDSIVFHPAMFNESFVNGSF
jgi:hypothetical protein